MLCRERQANGKNLRQREKKLKDLTIQMEDERKQAQQYKDQVTLIMMSAIIIQTEGRESGKAKATDIMLSVTYLQIKSLVHLFALCRRRRATCG